jgi:hypothetical protein
LRRTTKYSKNHRGGCGPDALFDEHIAREFIDSDVEATVVPDPYMLNSHFERTYEPTISL